MRKNLFKSNGFPMLSGCQCIYEAVGTYKGYHIATHVDCEMVGDLCGDDQA